MPSTELLLRQQEWCDLCPCSALETLLIFSPWSCRQHLHFEGIWKNAEKWKKKVKINMFPHSLPIAVYLGCFQIFAVGNHVQWLSLCINLDTHCAHILKRDSDSRSHRENLLGDFEILVLFFQNKYEDVCVDFESHEWCYVLSSMGYPHWRAVFSLLIVHRKKLDCALLVFLLLSWNAQLGLWVNY